MNQELKIEKKKKKMKSLGDFNELSINPMKTNFMLIKSAKKKKKKEKIKYTTKHGLAK